jgi:hypothetical protein
MATENKLRQPYKVTFTGISASLRGLLSLSRLSNFQNASRVEVAV